jgi:hypothetical protein
LISASGMFGASGDYSRLVKLPLDAC